MGEDVLAAVHVINITPTKVLTGKCAHKLLFGSIPSYSDLRVFGSLCFPHKQLRDKKKFASQSRRCVFVGYTFGKKGWQLYDLEKNEFFVSRDVIFKENEFPFSNGPSEVSPTPVITENFEDVFLTNEIVGIGNRGSNDDVGESTPQVPSVEHVSQDSAIIEIGPKVGGERTETPAETPAVVNPDNAAEIEVALGLLICFIPSKDMFTFLLNTGSLDVVYVFVIATTIEHRSYDIKPSVIVIIISTLITLNFESPSLSLDLLQLQGSIQNHTALRNFYLSKNNFNGSCRKGSMLCNLSKMQMLSENQNSE